MMNWGINRMIEKSSSKISQLSAAGDSLQKNLPYPRDNFSVNSQLVGEFLIDMSDLTRTVSWLLISILTLEIDNSWLVRKTSSSYLVGCMQVRLCKTMVCHEVKECITNSRWVVIAIDSVIGPAAVYVCLVARFRSPVSQIIGLLYQLCDLRSHKGFPYTHYHYNLLAIIMEINKCQWEQVGSLVSYATNSQSESELICLQSISC